MAGPVAVFRVDVLFVAVIVDRFWALLLQCWQQREDTMFSDATLFSRSRQQKRR